MSGLDPLSCSSHELACGHPTAYHRVPVGSLLKPRFRQPGRRPSHCVPAHTNPVTVRLQYVLESLACPLCSGLPHLAPYFDRGDVRRSWIAQRFSLGARNRM